MNQRKRRLESFAPFDFQGAEEHLSAMAARGWRLERAGGFFWTYRKAEPARVHYAVTCPPEAGKEEDRLFFQDLCETAGWEKVSDWAGMQIYATEAKDPTPLETDASFFLGRIHRAMRGGYLRFHQEWMLLFAISLLTQLMKVRMLPVSCLFSGLFIGITVCYPPLILFHLVCAAGYQRWYRRSAQSAREGNGLAPVPVWFKRMNRLHDAAALLALLLPAVLGDLYAPPRRALPYTLAAVMMLLGAGLALLAFRRLKEREVQQETLIAVGVLGVVVVLLAFGRQQIDPWEFAKSLAEPEEGEYRWQGRVWDEEPQAIPLTMEALTGRNWPHVRRSAYPMGRSPVGAWNSYTETVQQEEGESRSLLYDVYDISFDWAYSIVRKDLLGQGNPYQESDPGPWGAEAVYQRPLRQETGGVWLVFWSGRIARVQTDGFTLTGEQAAQAARHLAPKEAVL